MTNTNNLVEELTRKRDELRVQVHLASMEAKQEWEELEEKWNRFASMARLDDTVEGVEDSLDLLGGELAKGYQKLKAAL